MRLLFVIKALGIAGGGAERVLADVTAGLGGRGHDVTVASYDDPGSTDFYATHPTVKRLRLGLGDGSRPAGIVETLRRMRSLRRLVAVQKPDVVVAFMHSTYLPLGIALSGTGVPLLASEHIVYDHYRTRPLEAALLRLAPWIVSAMTVISERGRASFPRPLRKLMTVIANPVSVAASGRADVVGGAKKTVLTVGRMAEQKDHATLISAFALLADHYLDWNLRIVGAGPLRPELEAQISHLGLVDRVELPGPSAEIAREYLKAQLFAIPSLYESFGLVTAEALSFGLPAVGFADCPGTNELIVDGRNGLLVKPGADRVRALADGLSRLLRDEDLRCQMGSAGPESMRAYAPEAIVERWEQLLRSIARIAPPPGTL